MPEAGSVSDNISMRRPRRRTRRHEAKRGADLTKKKRAATRLRAAALCDLGCLMNARQQPMPLNSRKATSAKPTLPLARYTMNALPAAGGNGLANFGR
jgi:hypothetical protein